MVQGQFKVLFRGLGFKGWEFSVPGLGGRGQEEVMLNRRTLPSEPYEKDPTK